LDIGSCKKPRLAWTLVLHFMLPAITGMTGACHHTQLFPIEMGSYKLSALVDLNCDLPHLSFLSN
jgi:hypothetical protein